MAEDNIANWTYSKDEEHWPAGASCTTREEAIAEAPGELDLEPGDCFWTGRAVELDAAMVSRGAPSGASIVETLGEYLYDEFGHEDGFAASSEAEAELDGEIERVVAAWLVKHALVPHRFTVSEMESHVYEPCESSVVQGQLVCLTHDVPMLCPHACEQGTCDDGCDDKTDRELRGAK